MSKPKLHSLNTRSQWYQFHLLWNNTSVLNDEVSRYWLTHISNWLNKAKKKQQSKCRHTNTHTHIQNGVVLTIKPTNQARLTLYRARFLLIYNCLFRAMMWPSIHFTLFHGFFWCGMWMIWTTFEQPRGFQINTLPNRQRNEFY